MSNHAPAQLQVQVAFKGMDSSDPLREYANKRATKLVKYLHHLVNSHYVFQVEKTEHVAQLHVTCGDFDARAEGRAETMYAAVDEVTDKIIHQARRFNEKQHSSSGKPHHNQE